MENIILNIDSRFRNKIAYPNSGFFIHKLSEKIRNCKYIRLSSIEISNLYFTFSTKKKNTSFKITLYDGYVYTLTINDGIYNYCRLITAIQTELSKLNVLKSVNFTITFDINTGFVSIESDNVTSYDFSNGTNNFPSLGYLLGFRESTYNALSKIIPGTTTTVYYILSEAQLNPTDDRYLFLRINDYGVVNHDYEAVPIYDPNDPTKIIEYKQIQGSRNLFAKVILGAKASMVFDNGSNFLTKSYIFKQPVDLYKFEIELIDPRGYTIDMLYSDFSMTLEIGQVLNSDLGNKMSNDLFRKEIYHKSLNDL